MNPATKENLKLQALRLGGWFCFMACGAWLLSEIPDGPNVSRMHGFFRILILIPTFGLPNILNRAIGIYGFPIGILIHIGLWLAICERKVVTAWVKVSLNPSKPPQEATETASLRGTAITFFWLIKIVFFFVPATAIAGQAILGPLDNGNTGDWRYRCVAIISAAFIILIWMPGKTYRSLAAGRPGMPKTIVHAFTLVASIVGVFFAASESRPYAPMLIGPMAGAIVALKLYWLDDEQNYAEQVALMASIAIVGFGMQFFL